MKIETMGDSARGRRAIPTVTDATSSILGRSTPRPYLAILTNGSAAVFQLERDGTFVIGRGEDVDINVEEPSVSRRHAALRIEADQAFVGDLGSSNGTWLN